MSQKAYIEELLNRFGMQDLNPIFVPLNKN